jgi:hypothetical protein
MADELTEIDIYDDSYNIQQDPSIKSGRVGMFSYDINHLCWNKQWPCHDIFLVWLANKSKAKTIEFTLKQRDSVANGASMYTQYVCRRMGSGGEKKYTKKHPQ